MLKGHPSTLIPSVNCKDCEQDVKSATLSDLENYVYRLFNHANDQAVQEIVCDAMEQLTPQQITPLLPQLIQFAIAFYCPHVVELIKSKCKQSPMHFGLQTFFLLQAASEDKAPELLPKVNKLWTECENAAIASQGRTYGRRLSMYLRNTEIESLESTTDRFYAQLHMVRSLFSISQAVKNCTTHPVLHIKQIRNDVLHKLLGKFNDQIITCANLEYPLGFGTIIMRVMNEDAICLSSRNKVPYMIQLETLSAEDAKLAITAEKMKALSMLPLADSDSPPVTASDSLDNPQSTPAQTASGQSQAPGAQATIKPSKSQEDLRDEMNVEATVTRDSGIDAEWVVMGESTETPSSRISQVFGECWEDRCKRLRATSKYGTYESWKLVNCIVKYGDDLRQEVLAMQLINKMSEIFAHAKLPLYLRPYTILATSADSGLLEAISDTLSLDAIRKKAGHLPSLLEYFIWAYGHRSAPKFVAALTNFVESLAAYSLVCYLLQLKDRHNGNILLDAEGHCIHIDHGFVLSTSPGSLGWELAPFKLTTEFVQLMGGTGSDMFRYYKTLLLSGFLELRKYSKVLLLLVEMIGQCSKMPCFYVGTPVVVYHMRERFKLDLSEEQVKAYVDVLVNNSIKSWTTYSYDSFQYWSNGIL